MTGYKGFKIMLHVSFSQNPTRLDSSEQLHWLPVRQRITFKTSVNMHRALSDVLHYHRVSKLQQTWPQWPQLQPESNHPSHSQKGRGPVLFSRWSPMLDRGESRSFAQNSAVSRAMKLTPDNIWYTYQTWYGETSCLPQNPIMEQNQ